MFSAGKYKSWRKKFFTKEVKEFNPKDYSKKVAKEIMEKACNVFGHVCPVFFVNEPFIETAEMRNMSRRTPREIMLGAVRRDNYTSVPDDISSF